MSPSADAARDRERMALALATAGRGRGTTRPNPMVGAVVVRDDRVVGTGYHARAGGPHAEVVAVDAVGRKACRGATLYVTLEPCSHVGRTPPCADLVVDCEFARVVVGMVDPNPRVAGLGISRIREAGIAVDVGVLEAECAALNEGFVSRMTRGRPFVTVKVAVSLDGRIATRTGDSQWISGELSRRRVHELRAIHDAILVGTGTLLADNPRLTTRLPDHPDAWSPDRYALDPRLEIADDAALCDVSSAPTTLFAGPGTDPVKAERLRARGVRVVESPTDADGRLRIDAVMQQIMDDGPLSLLVEGGGELIGSLHDKRWIDRALTFVAPVVFGGRDARPSWGGVGVAEVADGARARSLVAETIGDDVLLTAEFEGAALQNRAG